MRLSRKTGLARPNSWTPMPFDLADDKRFSEVVRDAPSADSRQS